MESAVHDGPAHPGWRPESTGASSFWFAFLGGPLAWAAHFLASYGLVYLPRDFGVPLLVLVTVIAALITIGAGMTSWRLRGQGGGSDKVGTPGGLYRFFGFAGLLSSVLFLLLILVEAAVTFFLGEGA